MNDQSQKIILYGNSMCLMVPPVAAVLKRSDADFVYVDIFRDRGARETVRRINQGYESVPTVVFPDGSTLTEPGPGQLTQTLRAMGYTVEPPRWQKFLQVLLARLRAIL